jgi:hypothetical protein
MWSMWLLGFWLARRTELGCHAGWLLSGQVQGGDVAADTDEHAESDQHRSA